MIKELGSTLAKNVCQAKAKQPQKRMPNQQQDVESSRPDSEHHLHRCNKERAGS